MEPEKIAEGMFDLCDQDHTGFISIRDIQMTVKKCGIDMSPDDAFEVIKDIDEDGNGRLDKEEFAQMLKLLDVL